MADRLMSLPAEAVYDAISAWYYLPANRRSDKIAPMTLLHRQ